MSFELEQRKGGLLSRLLNEAERVPALPALPVPPASMFSFRYSYTEVSAQGGNAYVKRRETRLEEGRLVTEECEGAVDRRAYERMLQESQRCFLNQMTQALNLFYLPFSPYNRYDK